MANGSGPADRSSGGGRARTSPLLWLGVVVLLACHGGLAVSSMAVKSVTNDELSHLPAGLAAVATGEIHLNPQHPPLVKLLAGLAASTANPALPLDGRAYRQGNQWTFGRAVLFEEGNDHRALLFRGRLPVVGLSVLGGLGVFLWSRQRFGPGGGLLSLALYAFSPTVIAHGRLVTMDAAVAAGTVWALFLWWRLTRGPGGEGVAGRVRPGAAIGCGVVLGLALGAKFSGLILLPAMAAADLAAHGLVPGNGRAAGATRRPRWRSLVSRVGFEARTWLWVGVAAAPVVYLLYLLPDDPFRYLWDLGTLYSPNDPNRPYYLAGRFSTAGFPHYFLGALAAKTSVAGLVAMIGGLGIAFASAAGRRPRWRDDLYLWLPATLWLWVHSVFALDLGVRYMLPVYPLLFILAGGLVPSLVRWAAASSRSRPLVRVAAVALPVALAVAQLSAAVASYPDYLPFFNRLTRSGVGEHHLPWLDDSNLDWGQDLARLGPWLDRKGIRGARVLYYGAGVPESYGVERQKVARSDWWEAPRPGDYVVSVTYLLRGLYVADQTGAATDWLRRYEPSDALGGTLYLYRFGPEVATAGDEEQADQPDQPEQADP